MGTQVNRLGRVWRLMRTPLSVVLVVVGVVCLALSPVAIWGRNLILNTDNYVQTLEPAATNPDVQQLVIDRVAGQISMHVDVQSSLSGVLPDRVARVISPALQSGLDSLIDTTTAAFVHSRAFPPLWNAINRSAHEQLAYVLLGEKPPSGSGIIQINDQGRIELNVGSVVDAVKAELTVAGVAIAAGVPAIGTTIQIGVLKGLTRAQSFTRAVNTLANWLAPLGLLVVLGGVMVARGHRRAVIWAAIGLGAAMLVFGVVLQIVRHIFLGQAMPGGLSPATAGFLFDIVARFLRLGLRLTLLVALIVAATAWFVGPSPSAQRSRQLVQKGPLALGRRIGASRPAAVLARHAAAVRAVVVAAGGIVLLFVDGLTVTALVTIAVVVAALLLAVEAILALQRRSARHPA
jgi:hypothetical protein